MFTPEFRNRLDAIIPFAGLTPEIVGRVVEKFVMQLEAQLADRNVTIELSLGGQGMAGREAATTRSTARGRWAGSSRSTSRSRWPRSCCSASWSRAARSRWRMKDGKLDFEYLEAAAPALPKPEEGDGDEAEKEPETIE